MNAITHLALAAAVPHDVAELTDVLPDAEAVVLASVPAADAAASAMASPPTELYGSFFLGDDEFALPANSIREVVNYPAKVTPIPLAPAFLEGVFNLRGTVVPVLNLARIFDPNAAAIQASCKIAIVDHGAIQIGLAFHATGEILRVRPEHCTRLEYRDSASHNVISGIIRLDDGARLLQVLDPLALISIENVPQVMALKSTGRTVETSQFHLQAERRQCVAFRIGRTSFAFEMSAIREIIDVPELKSSVLNSKLCIGRINLRGSPVAVVDFAHLLQIGRPDGAPATTSSAAQDVGVGGGLAGAGSARRIVIARIGEASIGLLVDSVDNIFSFFPGDVLPIPLLSKARAGMFGGCIHKDGFDPILFLNHQEIFSSKEIVDMTRGHADLYQQDDSADASGIHRSGTSGTAAKAGKKGIGQRTVYIAFTVGNTYALEISKIREIIDHTSELMKPPGMPAIVEGVLNLRRQMVMVLNLRALYGMPPLMDKAMPKIMVIERGEERYGLLVDAVENIITVADSDRIPTPSVMRGTDPTDMRSQMQEVIELHHAEHGHKTMSVFEIDRFLDHLAREIGAGA